MKIKKAAVIIILIAAVCALLAAISFFVIANMQNTPKTAQFEAIKAKFNAALQETAETRASGVTFKSSNHLANMLKMHLPISKVCTANRMADCFGYQMLDLGNGKKYDILSVSTGRDLKMEGAGYNTDNAGILAKDGYSVLLAYDTECAKTNERNAVNNGTAVSKSDMQNCWGGIIDVNGAKKPNKLNSDVFFVNSKVAEGLTPLGGSCKLTLSNGSCFGKVASSVTYSCLSNSECTRKRKRLGLSYCNKKCDYYAGAVNYCGKKSKLPTPDELVEIAKLIYNDAPDIAISGKTYDLTYTEGSAEKYGLPEPPFILWSSDEQKQSDASYLHFGTTGTNFVTDSIDDRILNTFQVICREK
ncbi:MAG: hypothetical protein LUE64_06710 [Candidatus Gastranaerophilales bacterium]|nr:hypothetical protein [Candidatus Gastranaerophilales bacterium]